MQRFELILHRGHNLDHVENSVAGIADIRALAGDIRIEIDINVTRDGHAVLFHDHSLDRLCGVSGIISDIAYADLPSLPDGSAIPKLKDILEMFPNQGFILDLRDDAHPDLFTGSVLGPGDLRSDIATAVHARLRDALDPSHASHVRIWSGSLEQRHKLSTLFPDFEVDIAERYCRDFLGDFQNGSATDFLGPDPRRVYIRLREITAGMAQRFHDAGLLVVATTSYFSRSLENSARALQEARNVGADGLIVSPVSPRILKDLL